MKAGGKYPVCRTGLVKRKMNASKATHAILLACYKKLYSKTVKFLESVLGEALAITGISEFWKSVYAVYSILVFMSYPL